MGEDDDLSDEGEGLKLEQYHLEVDNVVNDVHPT